MRGRTSNARPYTVNCPLSSRGSKTRGDLKEHGHHREIPCCGTRHLPCRRSGCVICRPRPLAQVASSAPGGAPIAPPTRHALSFLRFYAVPCKAFLQLGRCVPQKDRESVGFGERVGATCVSPETPPQRKASLVQRVDFPVSGENVCGADKRGLGVGRRKATRRGCKVSIEDNPSVSLFG